MFPVCSVISVIFVDFYNPPFLWSSVIFREVPCYGNMPNPGLLISVPYTVYISLEERGRGWEPKGLCTKMAQLNFSLDKFHFLPL